MTHVRVQPNETQLALSVFASALKKDSCVNRRREPLPFPLSFSPTHHARTFRLSRLAFAHVVRLALTSPRTHRTSASARSSVLMIAIAASPSLRVAHAPRSLSRRVSSSRFVPGRRSLLAFARATEDGADEDKPPPGCSRYEVRIKKPLGLVLEEDKTGKIFVAEILEDSNAARTGLINVGDQLLATSAMVFNSTQDYGGVSVKKGEETIRFATRGEDFKTVMAAIGTVPSQRLVTLEFQKCI